MSGRGKKTSTKIKFTKFGYLEGFASDESEDLDYTPLSHDDQSSTSQSATRKKKRKRGTKLSGSKPAVKRPKHDEKQHEINTSLDWSHKIPNEILMEIFVYAVSTFSAVPLLCRVSQACKKWRDVATTPSLWRSVDLSYMANSLKAKDETLNLMRERNILEYVEHLNCNGWQKLTSAGLQVIANHCKKLKSINLMRCKRVTAEGLSSLASECTKLTSINLSSVQSDATSNVAIKNLMLKRGHQLEELHLDRNISLGTPSLRAIQQYCRNLKILELSYTSVTSFNVEKLQEGCPHMVELRLSQLLLVPSTVTVNQMEASPGFPDLELLSLASITGGDGANDRLLERLWKSSHKLRQLDVRGCEKITHLGLSTCPATSLEQLLLSRCNIYWKDLFQIINTKWHDSLKELDVSWCSLGDIGLSTLGEVSYPVLTKLNLAGTGVGTTGLSTVLESCPNLTALDLSSCRGVPRGLKKFQDADGIRKLRIQQNKWN